MQLGNPALCMRFAELNPIRL